MLFLGDSEADSFFRLSADKWLAELSEDRTEACLPRTGAMRSLDLLAERAGGPRMLVALRSEVERPNAELPLL